jgi:hypothetical protein
MDHPHRHGKEGCRLCHGGIFVLSGCLLLLPARAEWGTLSEMHGYAQCFGGRL